MEKLPQLFVRLSVCPTRQAITADGCGLGWKRGFFLRKSQYGVDIERYRRY